MAYIYVTFINNQATSHQGVETEGEQNVSGGLSSVTRHKLSAHSKEERPLFSLGLDHQIVDGCERPWRKSLDDDVR